MSSTEFAASTAVPQPSRRVVIAACFGHGVEWFEFGVYGYLATVLGKLFFPRAKTPRPPSCPPWPCSGWPSSPARSVRCCWSPWATSSAARAILATAVLLMGGATAAIGLLPTYASIGIAAPILLITCRLIQGLSAGGETSGAATFLAECAPPKRRGLWTSSIQSVGILSFVTAALLVAGLSAWLGADTMADWGWRIPFLLSFPLSMAGLYLRFKVEETPAFQVALKKEHLQEKAPLKQLLANYKKPLLLLIAIVAVEAVSSYIAKTYLPTYLINTIGLSTTTALLSTSVTLVFAACLIPFYAILSDRIGRKPLLIWGTVALIIVAIPAFLLIGSGSIAGAIGGQILAIIPGTAISTAVVVTQAELFPTHVRYSGAAALGYNSAYAMFGGTAPFVAAALIAATDSKLMPAFYLVVIGVIGLIVMTRLPETSKRNMDDAVRPLDPAAAAV